MRRERGKLSKLVPFGNRSLPLPSVPSNAVWRAREGGWRKASKRNTSETGSRRPRFVHTETTWYLSYCVSLMMYAVSLKIQKQVLKKKSVREESEANAASGPAAAFLQVPRWTRERGARVRAVWSSQFRVSLSSVLTKDNHSQSYCEFLCFEEPGRWALVMQEGSVKPFFAASICQLISEVRFWHPGASLQELLASLDLSFSRLVFLCTYFSFWILLFPSDYFFSTWEWNISIENSRSVVTGMDIRKGLKVKFDGLSYDLARDTVWESLPRINMVNSSDNSVLLEQEWESKYRGGSKR